ncbi:polysaccharide pyruvyl transferase family protein [Desulfofustis glycolicus]|uniref:Polysaccharide pyruvyl transferase n=1 Tax=Desulfofustis glycolicus DSM 9705 TaxID=1121409 RepID=A0A1M5YS69_9BACT|nr:polysaccharide pyruvyl transferase family protein [Desulfofustis glycolicus]SHI14947.1 Polysaccharide pyruvyl transferase [Desulfofustis glycolicus DSM 9705]
MRIGILTYQRAHNHGALLQAYALKKYVESLGHDVEFVDYWPDYHENLFRLIPSLSNSSSLKWLKALIKVSISLRKSLRRKRGYTDFIKNELLLKKIPKYKTHSALSTASYDVVIYGSDQIWREHKYTQSRSFDEVYFGEYLNCTKKISYAASMGVTEIESDSLKKMKNLLNNFSHLSVRENQLQKMIAKFTNVEPKLVLDPVFLLSQESWLRLLSTERIIKEKYIFFYQLLLSKEANDFVECLKEKTNFRIVELQGRLNPFKFGKRYHCQTANSFDFLRLIRDAEIVVSTSFHGVAFSILFRKKFYAIGMGKNSDRVNTLLQKSGLTERMIDNLNCFDFNNSIKQINENNFKQEIEYSKFFLKEALNDK